MRKVVGFSIEGPGLNYADMVSLLEHEHQATSLRSSQAIVELLGQQAEGLRRLSRLDESESLFANALQISRKQGVLWGEGWSLWGLASVFRAKGAHRRSALTYQAAATAAQRAGDRRCLLWSIAELSELDRIAGQHGKALTVHRHLFDEFLALGDWKGVCWASLGVAQIFRLRRQFDDARLEFRRSQELSAMIGNSVGEAWALRGLAEIAREEGEFTQAIEFASTARAEFSSLGYRLGAAYALKTIADALASEGRIHEAHTAASQCHKEFLACGERRGIGYSLLTVGMIWARMEEPIHAIPILQRSRTLLASDGESEPNAFSPSIQLNKVLSGLGKRASVSQFSELKSRKTHDKIHADSPGAELYAQANSTSAELGSSDGPRGIVTAGGLLASKVAS